MSQQYLIQYLEHDEWSSYRNPVTTKAAVNRDWFVFLSRWSKHRGCTAGRIVKIQRVRTSGEWLVREVVEYRDIEEDH